MSLFVIVFLCQKVTGMRFVLKTDEWLGNSTFVCVSLCLCVCVWYKFCAKLMGGWSCLSVAMSVCPCVFVRVSGISSVLN